MSKFLVHLHDGSPICIESPSCIRLIEGDGTTTEFNIDKFSTVPLLPGRTYVFVGKDTVIVHRDEIKYILLENT